ncbi:MAG: class II aldolase/adducin family protein [Candidatus Coprenecus sp.]|nr:class II aldolase/adducin family protein [Candidatus Coprenecus sp.]
MKELYDEFIKWAKYAGEENLMKCSSGNLSHRIGDKVLISGTGSWLGSISSEQISLCCVEDSSVISGPKPSIEKNLHLGLYRCRKDIDTVLHFQSEYATIVSCMENKPANFYVTLEIPLYIGTSVPVIPFYLPGSDELAQAVVEAMGSGADAALLSNHGQVVCGSSYQDCIQKAIFMEMACRIIVQPVPTSLSFPKNEFWN